MKTKKETEAILKAIETGIFSIAVFTAIILILTTTSSSIIIKNFLTEKTSQEDFTITFTEIKVQESVEPKSIISKYDSEAINSLNIYDSRRIELIGIADSKSMIPTMGKESLALGIKPKREELTEGDIIVYKLQDSYIIHRIAGIGKDESGTFYLTKGDNNPSMDKEKIRFAQIEYKIIGIIYIPIERIGMNYYVRQRQIKV